MANPIEIGFSNLNSATFIYYILKHLITYRKELKFLENSEKILRFLNI